jgi:gliding motility-associated-like protein
VLLLDESTSATPHQSVWNLGDGTTVYGERALHAYSEPGSYSVSLTVWTTDGCIDTSTYAITNMIEVWPLPTGVVTVDPDTQFVFDPAFVFEGTTDLGVSCSLYTGDGLFLNDTSSTCTIEHFYIDTGTYTAVMVFTDQNGCQVTDTALVRVEPEVRFWLPNAFTPNGDRINDTWGPKAFGFSEFELWVYDRWGKQMFYTTDPFEQWNGTFNNQGNHEPVQGVYAYRILARSVKSDVIRELGSVILVK